MTQLLYFNVIERKYKRYRFPPDPIILAFFAVAKTVFQRIHTFIIVSNTDLFATEKS